LQKFTFPILEGCLQKMCAAEIIYKGDRGATMLPFVGVTLMETAHRLAGPEDEEEGDEDKRQTVVFEKPFHVKSINFC